MAETIYVKGEGGAIIAMDLPLPEGIQERLDRGQIQRVHSDGTPYIAHVPAPAPAPAAPADSDAGDRTARPSATARKTEWVTWAVDVHHLAEADADAMTVAQLKDLPDQPEEPSEQAAPSGATGERPAEGASKSEWIAYVVKSGRLSADDAANYTKDDLIDLMR